MAKIKKKELEALQQVVNKIQSIQSQLGLYEIEKHALLHEMVAAKQQVQAQQADLEEKYGKVSIDVVTGEYKEIEEDETDKKD
jgi:DNA-binding protein H-NS|tara:strand:+ start:350 stop:598 length:249 start_codon:yes stop_codon:yes gene_type:complete